MRARPRYHHGDLRQALLRSVERIIQKRGIAFVSLREVARDARVSHSAPAHHFGNKAGLLTAFAAQGFERLFVLIEAELKRSGARAAPDVLEATGRAYVRFALSHPEQFGVMFRSELLDASSPEYAEAADRAYGLLRATVKRCVDEGHVAVSDVEGTTAAAWSIAHGFAALWIGGRLPARIGGDPEKLAARVLRAFVDGVVRA